MRALVGPRRIVALLAAVLLALGLASAVAEKARAQQNPGDTHRPATWNIQVGRDRWAGVYNLMNLHDVVALQEVPNIPPTAAVFTGRRLGALSEYRWQEGGRGRVVYLYILTTGSRNLGMATTWRADDIAVVNSVYRPMLAVVNHTTNTMFASAHASASGGGDAATLVRRAADWANSRGYQWAVMGDFNRAPGTFARPGGSYLYNAGQATQQSGGELDYMVSNVYTENWQASVLRNQGSDHWPVGFSSFQAASNVYPSVSISSDSNGGVLDVLGGTASNGAHVGVYPDHGGTNQRWQLRFLGPEPGPRNYRLLSDLGDWCLDVDNGLNSTVGSYNNVWQCHATNGEPETEHWYQDTQNFNLSHPYRGEPDRYRIEDHSTGMYLNILGNSHSAGAQVGQYWFQWQDNEYFHIHPES
ncbi:RICIN domain-containing protein [Actinomadura harenae]|uniref:RICIN domain-containing protein n=1 Tax=Actinomadura harenae TaxID=2483351 RepID=UPI0011C37AF2|nr:RICIN domain-containing protein [Actinomadura harenae]